MIELKNDEVLTISGGYSVTEFGYDVGYGIGYVIGGGAGQDLGGWLYEKLN